MCVCVCVCARCTLYECLCVRLCRSLYAHLIDEEAEYWYAERAEHQRPGGNDRVNVRIGHVGVVSGQEAVEGFDHAVEHRHRDRNERADENVVEEIAADLASESGG